MTTKPMVSDPRFTIGLEYCGFPETKYVLRWCGEFVRGFDSRQDAEMGRLDFAIKNKNKNAWKLLTNVDHVLWLKRGELYRIAYGADVRDYRDDLEAALIFGHCVRHHLECEGQLS